MLIIRYACSTSFMGNLRIVALFFILMICMLPAVTAQTRPVIIQNRRELFTDDYIIEKLINMETRLGVPVSRGVALKFDQPWEGQHSMVGTVIKDGPVYRMFYRGLDIKDARVCYAESKDGITWTRPLLKRVEVNGSADNNIISHSDNSVVTVGKMTVLHDTRQGVPAGEKFKALGGDRKTGLYVVVSGDGLTWRRYNADTTAVGVAKGYALDSPNVITWVPSENCYAIYMRGWTEDKPGVTPPQKNEFGQISPFYHGTRTLMRSVSKDLIHWSNPEMMKFGNTPMEHLYTNATQPYFRAPHLLISMPMRYNPDSTSNVLSKAELKENGINPKMWRGISDAVFMSSRGGNTFDRKFLESFIRPGYEKKNWAARSQMPALGVVSTGPDEISLYVTRKYGTKEACVERMTLRTDGFASLHAGYREGSAITKPLQLNGDKFQINFSSSPVGYIKVVILDEAGKELPGFGENDAIAVRGDEIDGEVIWKHRNIKELTGKTIRVKFVARDADIYSFGVFGS